jgi:poly(A) polymerase
VIEAQTEKLAIHRRFSSDMREIWGLQLRLEKRGRSAIKLLEHPRFRAGYDFLLLRCESGELDAEIGQWWTDFISGDLTARETLLSAGGSRERAPRKRRRRGGAKNRKAGEAATGAEGSGADQAYDGGHDGPDED